MLCPLPVVVYMLDVRSLLHATKKVVTRLANTDHLDAIFEPKNNTKFLIFIAISTR